MRLEDGMARHARAIAEFDQHEDRQDGAHLVPSLVDGLDHLRNSLFQRVHDDVERRFGTDSMLMPLSEKKSETETKVEIDVFQIAVSADEVRTRRFVCDDDVWYAEWLVRLRLGDAGSESRAARSVSEYLSMDPEQRRLAFTDALVSLFPEAGRAPLVLYRLFPLAVRISTDIAFGDRNRAAELRQRQLTLLPAVADCSRCRGRLLDNEDSCQECGNPLWKYEWLTASF
jgi:hypothetical protein